MTPSPTAIRVILLALALVGAGRLLPGHQARATEIQPLDLPAMVLNPGDIEIHGLTGYGNDYGEYLTTRDYAAGFARDEEIDFEVALEIFEDMGLLRSYTVRLALPSEPDDFYSDATAGIHVGIFEYDSDASADAMFDLAQDEIEDGDAELVEGSKEFGDDWFISRSDADDVESGDPARELTLEFRVGHLNALITLFDIARDSESSRPTEPDIDVIEQLGELLLDRIESADSSEQPLLGIQALRLTDADGSVVTVGDRYAAIDSTPFQRYAESDATLNDRADRMGEDGMVATYSLEQDVRSGNRENPADPHLTLRLYQFGTEDDAEDWLDEAAYERFAAEAYVNSIELLESPIDVGDASVAAMYTAEYGGADLEGTIVWVLVDDTVARITLDGAEPIDLEVVEVIVDAQVECLLGSPCESLEVPAELT